MAILKALGFTPSFTQVFNTLFFYASTVLSINKHKFGAIGPFKSIRQGCPLAPALYVHVAKGFHYLLAQQASQGIIQNILLPGGSS